MPLVVVMVVNKVLETSSTLPLFAAAAVLFNFAHLFYQLPAGMMPLDCQTGSLRALSIYRSGCFFWLLACSRYLLASAAAAGAAINSPAAAAAAASVSLKGKEGGRQSVIAKKRPTNSAAQQQQQQRRGRKRTTTLAAAAALVIKVVAKPETGRVFSLLYNTERLMKLLIFAFCPRLFCSVCGCPRG